jgi:hypothetical protein
MPTQPRHPEDCPCVTFDGDSEIPTLMGSVLQIDACTNFGVGLTIKFPNGDGSHTQLSIGQARQAAADLIKAVEVIEASLRGDQAVIR